MTDTSHHDERIATMSFASVYPHYVTKAEKKGRTKEELHQIIQWLTGYDEKKLQQLIDEKTTFENSLKALRLILMHILSPVLSVVTVWKKLQTH